MDYGASRRYAERDRENEKNVELTFRFFLLMKQMLTLEDIKAYSDEIVKKFDPDKIILFGSYAYGTPRIDYLERRAKMGDIIMREIANKGKLLYERSNA